MVFSVVARLGHGCWELTEETDFSFAHGSPNLSVGGVMGIALPPVTFDLFWDESAKTIEPSLPVPVREEGIAVSVSQPGCSHY